VLAAVMITSLVVLGVACVYVGSAVIARHRAQAAADLAALAGAGGIALGAGAACAQATAVAHAMRTTVASCTVDRLDVVVTVAVPVSLGRFGAGSARAVAKAGPAN
jgi:secretion/DNA translocation related TadE-like protein